MAEVMTKQTFGFQAEVKQLLQMMIHSLYSNKEIFLRELISNASDAAAKLRFEALHNPDLIEGEPDLKVWVSLDQEAKTLTIRDNGIGMSKDEVIQNLGTIARSGTREFLNRLTGDQARDSKLIGQFGVGFYSSFIVANRVVVTTRRAGLAEDQGICWSSTGEGEYELGSLICPERGTKVVLHLKEEEQEFLNSWRLRHIITKYSDHLTLPVIMKNDQGEEEVVNREIVLWTLPKKDITDEQYKEFYKYISHDFADPLLWGHNKVEGKLEYTSLLYIPSHAPFDLSHRDKARGLKLFVKRVFIMDDAEQFLPNYLRFIRGIIDCDDLPLNISREILQNHRQVDSIKSALTKRVLGMLEELAEQDKEKYQHFWREFGRVLKEGPLEDFANKEEIINLLRFSTTHTNSENQDVSLEAYISRMPAHQDKIYYITAQTFNTALNSPHLEVFKKKGIEVLLLSEPIDEWLVTQVNSVREKTFQSAAKGSLDLGELADKSSEEEHQQTEDDFSETLKKTKDVLQEAVKEVRLSRRLTDSPACIVSDEQGPSIQMERILRASGQNLPNHKPILELNGDHPMVKQLKNAKHQTEFEDWAWILLDQAILVEGGQLEKPANFVQRLNKLLLQPCLP